MKNCRVVFFSLFIAHCHCSVCVSPQIYSLLKLHSQSEKSLELRENVEGMPSSSTSCENRQCLFQLVGLVKRVMPSCLSVSRSLHRKQNSVFGFLSLWFYPPPSLAVGLFPPLPRYLVRCWLIFRCLLLFLCR